MAVDSPPTPREEREEGTASPAGSARGTLRVLAIDDEPAIVNMVAEVLCRHGHVVAVAHSAQEGLERLEAGSYDLVISDLGLGAGVTGWELAEAVRRRWPRVRFALSTGWGAGIDPEEAKRRGVEAVLAKPFRSADLLRLVDG